MFLGRYANGPGSFKCEVCPAGQQCEAGTNSPAECPQGYYCLSGDSDWPVNKCPIGTFGATNNLTQASECTDCSAGKYCDREGATNYTGACNAGHWCKTKSTLPNPFEDLSNKNFGLCLPGGYYCPQGTDFPKLCPPGTFSKSRGLMSVNQCTKCTPGSYCDQGNQTAVTGLCTEGYFCKYGSSEAAPVNKAYGDVCPEGTFCITGSIEPTLCQPGTYNNGTGQKECKTCPKGFYCEAGSVYPSSCPKGFWCGEGTQSKYETPCPAGTFGNAEEHTHVDNCTQCTPGYYCEGKGI